LRSLRRAGESDQRRGAVAERFESDCEAVNAQFQEIMEELQPYIALWNESRQKEVAAAASH
jgi:hypothetical protein